MSGSKDRKSGAFLWEGLANYLASNRAKYQTTTPTIEKAVAFAAPLLQQYCDGDIVDKLALKKARD